MIYIDEAPFSPQSDSSSQGGDILLTLMDHPVVKSVSTSLNAIPEQKFTISEDSAPEKKCVYVFQREYATVDPALVDLAGTDEATTCVGIAIRNRTTRMTSVGHMDSPNIVDNGLSQMLSLVLDQESDSELDVPRLMIETDATYIFELKSKVHLVGAFDDVSPQHDNGSTTSRSNKKEGGYSFPLCTKIVESLHKSHIKFHLKTLHVLGHNTRWDKEGIATPIFHGFLIETSTGSLTPASFDRTSRCPDEVVRRIRITACSEDLMWKGRLLDTYETQSDRFVIAPCFWTKALLNYVLLVQEFSDTEILLNCSTSPYAEGPDFVENERRIFDYLIQNPKWKVTFPAKQPRIFGRNINGAWIRQMQHT